ncbi:hypothetical protein ACQPX6_18360 [Actinomycetospora sp. CA-101289]|uniref:hypothetical protein n=1 Tax=Actinomycetospora sp. CA-101289 TaxID=3239893 RepID=UPI003D986E16
MTSPDPDEIHPDPTRPESARPDTASSQDGADPAGHEPEHPGLPDDVDAAFAAIVADWAAAGAPRWPDELPDLLAPGHEDGPSSGLGTATPPGGQPDLAPGRTDGPIARPTPPTPPSPRPESRTSRTERPTPPRAHTPPPEDEHYVPPEPPPLPRLGLSSLLGLALLVVGVVLLAVPGLLGGPVGLGIVPGLLAMTAGLGWLVFGLRRGRDEGPATDPDDGAVL